MNKSLFYILTFSACLFFFEPVKAPMFENIEVPDGSIAAKYFPDFFEKESFVAVVGSIAANANSRRVETEKELNNHFPDGEPQFTYSQGDDTAEREFFIYCQKVANYRAMIHKVEKCWLKHDKAIWSPSVIAKLAMEVEKNPNHFVFLDKKPDESNIYSFPFRAYSSPIYKKIRPYLDYCQKNAATFYLIGIKEFSDVRWKDMTDFFIQMPEIKTVLSEEQVGSILERTKEKVFSERYDFEDWKTAKLIIQDIVLPLNDVLKNIQKESLELKAEEIT